MNQEIKNLDLSSENKEGGELAKYESAIRKFLKEQIPKNLENRKLNYGFDFDISGPVSEDIRKIQSGDFEITNFHTTLSPSKDGKLNFHFYVGQTEFHITGRAANRIYELMNEM